MTARRPGLLYVVTLAEVGGAQSYVRDLLPATREAFDVAVAAFGDGPLRTACAEGNIPFVPLRHVRREISPLRDLRGLAELVQLFRRLRPDIVHLNSSKAGVLGRIAAAVSRVPVRVFTVHGWAFKAEPGIKSRVYLWADRLVRPLTTMIICVSQTERSVGLAAGTCSAAHTTVIPNAVDVGSALPHAARGGNVVELVSVGRLAEPKDFSSLLEALALLPAGAAHMRILGDGPQRPLVESLIAGLGLNGGAELVGEVPDVRPYLAQADVFVLSSRSEGMPIAVLEAMAASLPVVASAVGGLHEVVVDGRTGLLTPAADPGALAAALGRLVADPGLRARLGEAGRERAERHFSLPSWQEAHLRLYHDLLAAR